MNKNIEFLTIYGEAGTGKSHYLANLIIQSYIKDEQFIVLTATHKTLENIYQICKKLNPNIERSNFKTIFSFFRIDYINNIVLGAFYLPSIIYIDEFGLVDKNLFEKCLFSMRLSESLKIILAGDVLQLNPVNVETNVNFSQLKKHLIEKVPASIQVNVIEHYYNNLFSENYVQKNEKKLLTKNYRSEDKIMKIINNLYKEDIIDNELYKFVCLSDVLKKINNENYVVLASRYKILQLIYDRLYENNKDKYTVVIDQKVSFRLSYKRLYLYKDMELMITTNSVDKKTNKLNYYNGQIVIFTGEIEHNCLKCLMKDTDDTSYVYIEQLENSEHANSQLYYPVSPTNLISIHKSQGYSIDSVIVCIDEMFDMSLVYTAITRCKNNLLFYTKESNYIDQLIKESYRDDIKHLRKTFLE